jgi:vitamin B12 transporter
MTVRLRKLVFLSMLFVPLFISAYAFAMSEEEKKVLNMFFTPEELKVVSATRSMQSISRVAENMTVITAKDIALMNAHTIPEVLNTITGVQVQWAGADLGTNAVPLVQGSDFRHVTVLVDGIPVNNLPSGSPELIGILPVQIVDRIEVIRGPASSVWGSSLGGVINIITKAGKGLDPVRGTLSASYGERNTGDYRAEAYGTSGKFGYYLFAGDLRTDGLRRDFDVSVDRFYTKLDYSITPGTGILFSLYHDRGRRGEGDNSVADPTSNYSDRFEHTLANLSLNSRISPEVALNVALRRVEQTFKGYMNQISDGSEVWQYGNKEITNGATAKLTWTPGMHTVVVGADYDKGSLKSDLVLNGTQEITKSALFINDTMTWGKLSVIPGLRYQDTDRFGDFVSPSLGMTYQLTDSTLLRATAARGFNIPGLSDTFGGSADYKVEPDLKVEKVWSYQAGFETTSLPYVWLKVSAFRHDISDAIVQENIVDPVYTWTEVNKGKVRRQGVEAEVKTIAVYNTSLFAGAAFIDAKDLLTGETMHGTPRYTFDAGLKYNEKTFKAILQGHYIWWNEEASSNAKYNSMIVDLSAAKTVYRSGKNSCDLFLTAHNIFDGSQYRRDYYPNPGRWVEGGVRYKF